MRSVFSAVVLAALIGLSANVHAICVASTDVTSTVTPAGQQYDYDFSVINGCNAVNQPLLTSFFLPYFSDAGITNIDVPQGWTYSVEPNNDVFGLNAGVIEFDSTTPLGYYGSNGFTYTADYTGIKGPFAMDLTTNGVSSTLFGDPLIPASPDTIAALGGATVPEPPTTALFASGLLAMLFVGKRFRLVY